LDFSLSQHFFLTKNDVNPAKCAIPAPLQSTKIDKLTNSCSHQQKISNSREARVIAFEKISNSSNLSVF
jgi:hypothetical protein